MDVSSASLLAPSQQTVNSGAKLAENFDDFLTLLTTQLKHQNPLEPMDANEFTTQLVQFSSVEQAIAQNARLDSLIGLQKTAQVTDAVSFIGKTVEAAGDKMALADGEGSFNYTLSKSAANVGVVIRNDLGQIVRTTTGANQIGPHEFVWDGLNNQGVEMPDGTYTVEVSAIDDSGASYPVTTNIVGLVDGVTSQDGSIVLSVGGVSIPLSAVLAVRSSDS